MLEKDRKLVKEAGSFLVESVLFKFLHDCIQLVVMPMDGEGLTQAMHTRGINVRYLGCIAQMSAVRNDLQHILVSCGSNKGGHSDVVFLLFLSVCVLVRWPQGWLRENSEVCSSLVSLGASGVGGCCPNDFWPFIVLFVQGPTESTSECVCHFLNCLFCAVKGDSKEDVSVVSTSCWHVYVIIFDSL